MDKVIQFIGVDISKDTFDIWISDQGHFTFKNDVKGFKSFSKLIKQSSWCVMEATGCYYQQLAMYLHKKGIQVSVLNPLIIKRFIQMKLQSNKTDKSDAKMICQYAQEQPLKLWKPDSEYISECKMIHTLIDLYFKQSTALKNKLHSFNSKGISQGVIIRSIKKQLNQLQKEIQQLENQLESLVKEHDSLLFSNLKTINGIGKKTAILLITQTNGFKNFQSAKQLSSYLGLAPTERSSGTSVRGTSRISKRGNPLIRNHLFLCSFTACKTNIQCKNLYERITSKGKSKKLALIAVSNKLIKQAFAIAISGIPYDSKYKSRLIVE